MTPHSNPFVPISSLAIERSLFSLADIVVGGPQSPANVSVRASVFTQAIGTVASDELRHNVNGLLVNAATGATIGVDVEKSSLSDHASAAISATNNRGTVNMTLSASTVVHNGTGVVNSGAVIESLGNNTFNYDGANGGPLTPIPSL